MINFSKIPNTSIPGALLRHLLKVIPRDAIVRILQGRLRGKRWIKGSGVNGYWLGTYELEKQTFFINKIRQGCTIFDIGAHAGFYSLLAAEITGSAGKVFSFEPSPNNFEYLKKHIALNSYHNIFPFQVAVLDISKSEVFVSKVCSPGAYISDFSETKAKAISIDEWIEQGILPLPDIVKIDTEGSEISVLKGMRRLLEKKRPIIFLSTHGTEIKNLCLDYLVSFGYEIMFISEDELLAKII